jgi:uncharacterized membrane protein (DUF4010 family)
VIGAAAASLTTIVYAAVVVGFASRGVLERIWPVLAVSSALLTVEIAVVWWRAVRHTVVPPADAPGTAADPPRAFALLPAIGVAALLTTVRLVARWGSDVVGSSGVVLTGTVAGLADAHGAIIGMVSLVDDGALSSRSAIIGSAGALAANTIIKLILASAIGGRSFAFRLLAMLAAPYAVLLAGLVLVA